MNSGSTVFAQLLSHLPRHTFCKFVDRYQGHYRVRTFSCWDQFIAMASGYDLTEGHAMASILGHSTSNRPLLGFVKRHRAEDPRIQRELNIALGDHAREGNERGVALCLWAGADPHVPALSLNLGIAENAASEDDEEPLLGWSAIEEAARAGHLGILKRLGPDPARDNFDELYEHARCESIVSFLLTMQPPRDLTRILWWHFRWLEDRFPITSAGYSGTGVIEAILKCGVRWEERDPGRLAEESRDKNADFYDFAPVGAIDLDEDGIIRGINLSGTAMLGAGRQDLLGLPFASFVPREDQDVYRNHLLECKRSSEGVITELLLNTRKGVPTKVQIFSYPKQDLDRVVYRTLMTELSSRQQADEKSAGG